MADRYLLEGLPATSDGYLLEDGSGVLILDCNLGFQFDAFQSPGFQSCPYVTPAVRAYQSIDEVQRLPVDDPTVQSWAVQTFAAAAFDPSTGFPWQRPDEGERFVVGCVYPDITTDTLYAFGNPLNAVAKTAWQQDDDERYVASSVVEDTTPPGPGLVPPVLSAFAVEGGEVQSVPGEDPSVQSWAVGPPQNVPSLFAWNDTTEVPQAVPVDDPTVQSWAVQVVGAAPAFDPASGFPWNIDDGERFATQQLTDDNVGYALGLVPQNATQAQAFNTPDEATFAPTPDDTGQAWAIAPLAFDPASGFPWPRADDIVQPVWSTDDTTQSWAVGPPANVAALFAWNDYPADPILPPWFMDADRGASWAATIGVEATVTGGLPPGISGTASVPGIGGVTGGKPAGSATAPVPGGEADHSKPDH